MTTVSIESAVRGRIARALCILLKTTPLLAAAVASVLWLTGCGSKKPETALDSTKAVVIGFSQVGAESDWRVAETKSIREEASNRGLDLKFSDAQGKQENQITAVRSFIAQGVSAIILAPKVETGWEPVLKEARQAKIPVILVDRGIKVSDESLYATLIASDFVEEGRMAADWLAKKTGGKASIIELEGDPGAAPAIDRKKGFAEGIKAHPGMKIIASQSANFETGKGKEVTETLLQKHGKEVTAIYAHNDNMALGAIEAIKAAGRKPGTDILIVSIDGVKGAFQAMVAGELNCTIECNPLLGPAVFDAVENVLDGKPVPKRTVVKDQVFDQSTAKDLIGSRQY
jgi:ABC-type sugar transport system substrate-binding protein